ncbi:MAG: hypothetical protein KJ907_10830 [Actinobacteria bacterium]|nr:hypothetical protein [Actinomycetota bacterium]MBU4403210.1 hypothetical protein [Actinomycetota bacterium]
MAGENVRVIEVKKQNDVPFRVQQASRWLRPLMWLNVFVCGLALLAALILSGTRHSGSHQQAAQQSQPTNITATEPIEPQATSQQVQEATTSPSQIAMDTTPVSSTQSSPANNETQLAEQHPGSEENESTNNPPAEVSPGTPETPEQYQERKEAERRDCEYIEAQTRAEIQVKYDQTVDASSKADRQLEEYRQSLEPGYSQNESGAVQAYEQYRSEIEAYKNMIWEDYETYRSEKEAYIQAIWDEFYRDYP